MLLINLTVYICVYKSDTLTRFDCMVLTCKVLHVHYPHLELDFWTFSTVSPVCYIVCFITWIDACMHGSN